MGKFRLLLLLVICFVAGANGYSQTRELKDDAAYYFDKKDYRKAYELYDKLYTLNPKDLNSKFRLGYSSLFYPEKKARAIEIFEDIKGLINRLM